MGILNLFKKTKAQDQPYRALMALYGRNPIWTEKDIRLLAEEGFKNCMTVFACVTLLSKGAAGIPWQLFKMPVSRDTKKEEIYSHELLDRIRRPNPHCGQASFIENLTAFYFIAGNSYMLQLSPSAGPPRELHYLFPHLVRIMPGTRAQPVATYNYYANPRQPDEYEPEDVLHLKAFHPLNSYYGLPPLEVAAKGIDIANMTMNWNMKLLQNDMRPPGIIKIEGDLDKEDKDDLKADLKANYQGFDNVAMPLIFEGGQDWIQTALSPKDLDWITGDKMNMRKICSVLNVASELIGDSENKTYSNVKEAYKALYTKAILPFLDFFRDELNNWLVPKWGDERLRLDYNRDSIEELKEEMSAVYERMEKAWWLRLNEKRLACGFDEDPAPEANQIYLPISLVPLGTAAAPKDDGNGGAKSTKKPSFWQKQENKERLWIHFARRVEAKERALLDPLNKFFTAQAKRVRAALARYQTLPEIDIMKLLDEQEETKLYLKQFEGQYLSHFLHAGRAGIQAAFGKLLDLEADWKAEEGFIISGELRKKVIEMIMDSGTKLCQTSLKKVANQIIKAQGEGITVEAATQAIFDKLTSLGVTRSRTFARTEMAKVENFGQLEGYKQTQIVERKGWLCAFVPDSRDSHIAADAEYSDNPIALDDFFQVGGDSMQYPGDPGGSAANVVNCLCATYPEVREI